MARPPTPTSRLFSSALEARRPQKRDHSEALRGVGLNERRDSQKKIGDPLFNCLTLVVINNLTKTGFRRIFVKSCSRFGIDRGFRMTFFSLVQYKSNRSVGTGTPRRRPKKRPRVKSGVEKSEDGEPNSKRNT